VDVMRDPWCVGRHSVCCVMALYCRLRDCGDFIRDPWWVGINSVCVVMAIYCRLSDCGDVVRDPWCVGRHSVCCVMTLNYRLREYCGCYQGPVVCWKTQCLLCDGSILSASRLR
jgi:hypothetical protein